MKRLSRETLFKSDHLNQDLRKKAARGGMTAMIAQGSRFILGLTGTVVLARVLTPADFGLFAMVAVIVRFATMFKDAGLSVATIQQDHITHEQISTLFWVNFLLNVFLGICLLACSPLVAMFYGRPELTKITAVLSSSFLFTGLVIQHQALLRRHMKFGALATIKITSQVIALIVTISLAFLGASYWALVGRSLTNGLVAAIMTILLCPWRPGRARKGTGVRSMLGFGGHLTGFNIVNFLSRNLDNILIGRFIGTSALGVYSKAYELFLMPLTQIRSPLIAVALPVLSSIRNQPDRYIKYYQRILDVLASLAIPITLYCAVESEFVIRLSLGAQWVEAVPVFRNLAIAGLIQVTASAARGMVLLSFGFSARYLRWGLFNAILMITAIVAGLPFGIQGVAASYTVANYIILVPSLFYCFHGTPVRISIFIGALGPPLFVGAVAATGTVLVKYIGVGDAMVGHLVGLATFVVIYGAGTCLRASFLETLRIFLTSVHGRSATQPKGSADR